MAQGRIHARSIPGSERADGFIVSSEPRLLALVESSPALPKLGSAVAEELLQCLERDYRRTVPDYGLRHAILQLEPRLDYTRHWTERAFWWTTPARAMFWRRAPLRFRVSTLRMILRLLTRSILRLLTRKRLDLPTDRLLAMPGGCFLAPSAFGGHAHLLVVGGSVCAVRNASGNSEWITSVRHPRISNLSAAYVASLETRRLHIQPGTRLALLSDGLAESVSRDDVFAALSLASPEEIVARVLAASSTRLAQDARSILVLAAD